MIPKGLFTTKEAEACGISRTALGALARNGAVERLARGVYAKPGDANAPMLEAAVLAKRGTDFILSLESALQAHNFTSASPNALWISMRRGSRRPNVDFPLEIVAVDPAAYGDGSASLQIAGVRVRVTSPAKTVADLFKFRSRTGLDLALEALKEGFRLKLFTADELLRHAKINRVKNILMPYVEGCLA